MSGPILLHVVRAEVDEQIRDAWHKCRRLERLPVAELRVLYRKHRGGRWPGAGKAAGRLSVIWQVNV